MKTCCRCKVEKPDESFNWKDKLKEIRQYECRECHKKYNASHYGRNKAKYQTNNTRRKVRLHGENYKHLFEYLTIHPCVDCGFSNPLALEFDHQRDKKTMVCRMMIDYTWESIMKEIDKCEVRCANCHAIKTAKQFGYKKLEYLYGTKTTVVGQSPKLCS